MPLNAWNDQGEVVATVPYSTITAVDSSPTLPLNYDLPGTLPANQQGAGGNAK